MLVERAIADVTRKDDGKGKFDTCGKCTNEGKKFAWNGVEFLVSQEKSLNSKVLTYFPHIPNFSLASSLTLLHIHSLPSCSVQWGARLRSAFLQPLKSAPRIISRDGIMVWVCMCILNQFQCHSIFLIGLNESCFYNSDSRKKGRAKDS